MIFEPYQKSLDMWNQVRRVGQYTKMKRFFLVKDLLLKKKKKKKKNQNSGMFESSDLIFTPPQPVLLETTNPLQQHKI